MASHYSIHIQTNFQFSLLAIHVIENKQLTINDNPFIEREVLRDGSIIVAILFSWQDMKTIAL